MSDVAKVHRPKPPEGWRFDPFADVRMGKSLFQMSPTDWLVPDDRNHLKEQADAR